MTHIKPARGPMIEITVDPTKALAQLDRDEKQQIPFALSRAINSTALDVQRAGRNRFRSVFTLRRPDWADRSMKIKQFATKRNPVAIIGIESPGNAQRSDILAKFETDTQKVPRGRSLAIPVGANVKRNNKDIITKAQRPAAYNFHKQGNRIVGDRRTFIIRKPDGSGLILQRKGRGRRSQTFALYILAKRARLVPDLKFIPGAQSVVDTRFNQHMQREFDNAMRTAR